MIKPRNGGTLRHYVPASDFRAICSDFAHAGVFYIRGHSSIFVPSVQAKFIIKERCKPWPDLNYDVIPTLPSEAARTELKREWPCLKKIGWRGIDKHLFSWGWPMYCLETGRADGAHIDLVAAYWQIYRNLWLDCRYPNGRGELSLRPVAERLKDWKAARNSLIGITASKSATAVKQGRSINIYPDNPWLTPHLWAQVQSVLNGIAMVAKSCGAVYCMTDGYLFFEQEGAELFLGWLDKLGIKYRVDWGKVDVLGWMSYQTPTKTTLHYKQGKQGGKLFEKIMGSGSENLKNVDYVFNYARSYTDAK